MNIRNKLIICFLLVSLLPLALFAYIYYRNSENRIKEEVVRHLNTVSDYKVSQLTNYINVQKADILTLAHTPDVIEAMGSMGSIFKSYGPDSREYADARKKYGPFLEYIKESLGHYDLLLISPDGNIIFNVADKKDFSRNLNSKGYEGSELAEVFKDTRTTLQPVVSGFEYYRESDEPAVFIASPIFKEGHVTGVVAIRMSNDQIYSLLRDYTGLGHTGETLAAQKIGDEAVFMTPLRHDAETGFKKRVLIGSKEAVPAQEAVRGIKGEGRSIDYRGESILAVWRYVPNLNIGIVAKIDEKEAFAPITDLKRFLLLLTFAVVLLVVILAVLVSRSISRPILILAGGADIIGNGDLDHKISTRGKDEIGQLSRSFDKMRVKLKSSYSDMERKVKDLEEAKLSLEQSNKELEQFAYVASHDLQEPLRMVTSYTQLLIKRYGDKLEDKDARDFMFFITDGAERMKALINDLLTLSRVSTKGKPFEDVSCEEVVKKSLINLSVAIEESDARVTHDELPVIKGDDIQILQLFQNLIGNAIKFRKEAPPEIHISCREDKGYFIFSVRDKGIGIDMHFAERIFLVFERIHDRGKYPGTGIGLSLCKKIVERHGGRIWIESVPLEGTTFYFTIPC